MAIFTNTSYLSSYETPDYDIQPTQEASSEILYEFARDIYKLQAATYVADIMIESAITEGTSYYEASVLVEKSIKELIDNAIAKFKELWAKIKAWFKRIKEKIKVFFMKTEKFVTQYESKIKENFRKYKGTISYNGYPYDKDPFNEAKGLYTKIEEYISNCITITDDKATLSSDVKSKIDDFKDDMYNSYENSDSLAEMKEAFTDEVRGSKEKLSINVTSVDGMISFIKGYKKQLKEVDDAERKTEKNINACIKALEKSKNKGKNLTDEQETSNSQIGSVIDGLKEGISAIQGINALTVSLVNSRVKEHGAVLKKILFVKNAKESYSGGSYSNSDSLFESALNML